LSQRVAIFTFHFSDNVGALLQTYGLANFLRSRGVDAHVVDYHPAHVEDGGAFLPPVSKQNIRADIIIAYQKMTKFINATFGNKEQVLKSASFRENHLFVSETPYSTLQQLLQSPPEEPVYICGSDQIWNPSPQFGVDPAYFLSFGDEAKTRISYAASFGKDSLEPRFSHEVGSYIDKFNAVSIREETGVNIVKQVSSKPVHWLPDPTLLIENYDNVIHRPSESRPYIFSYVLRSGKDIVELQRYLAEKYNLGVVTPHNPMRRWKTYGKTIFPGPQEWLGYLHDARYVITNSFHGTVFSVLFNKPFVSVGLSGKKSGLNARARSFLGKVGLQDRLLVDPDRESLDALLNKEIDWSEVNSKVAAWRKEGQDFLLENIMASDGKLIPSEASL